MRSHKSTIRFIMLTALVLVIAAIGGVYAYLSVQSGPVENVFTPETPTNPSIVETFDKETKKDVAVKVGNPGYAVYVRAVIVVTWEKEIDGKSHVHATKPVEGTDYEITLNTDDWFKQGEFYYHRAMVNSGLTTANLIELCQLKEGANVPGGYTLHVEIIAQTIQALGTTDGDPSVPAVTNAWHVNVGKDTNLVPNS